MIHWFDSLPSTMTAAAEMAAAGCEPLTAVAALEQTAGQGRYGRQWHSAAGDGLYVSIVLPSGEPLPWITLALGLAVREALRRHANVTCDLRWPNDVMLHDRKLCGILTQFANNHVIAGIGINLNHEAFPPELARIATSLRLETKRRYDPREVLDDLLPEIAGHLRLSQKEIRDRFVQVSSWATGRHVFVEEMNLQGVTAGLTPEGFLLVRDGCGKAHTIVAGGVRAAGA